jgi:hypothetical protein
VPNLPQQPANKQTAKPIPSVTVNIVQGSKPAKSVSVGSKNCCLSQKGAKR